MIFLNQSTGFFSTKLLFALVVMFCVGQFSASAQTLFISSSEELGIVNLEDGSYAPLTVSPLRSKDLDYDSFRNEILSLEGDERTITRFDGEGGFLGRVIAAEQISDLTVTSSGEYYASTSNRIVQLDRRTGELVPFAQLQASASIRSLITTNDELIATNSVGDFVRISLQDRTLVETKTGDFQTIGYGPDPSVVYAVDGVGNRTDSGAVYRVNLGSVPAEFELIGTFDDVYAASASGDADIIYLATGDVLNGVDELSAYTISTATSELLPINTNFQFGTYAYGSTPTRGILAMVYNSDDEQIFGLRFYNAPNNTLTPDRAEIKSYTGAERLLRLEGNDLLAYKPDFTSDPGSSRLYDAGNFSRQYTELRQRGEQLLYEDRSRDRLLIRDGQSILSIGYDLRRTTSLGSFSTFPGETIWAESAGVFAASQVSGQTVSLVETNGNVTSTFRLDFARFGYDFYEVTDNNILFFSGGESNVGEDLRSKSLTDLSAPEEIVFEINVGQQIVSVEGGRDSTEVFLILKSDNDTDLYSIIKDPATGAYSSTVLARLPTDLFISDARLFNDLVVSGSNENSSAKTPVFEAWWDGEELQIRRDDTQPAKVKVHDLGGRLLGARQVNTIQNSLVLTPSNVAVVVVSIEINGSVGTKLVPIAH